jgi:pyruvate formate lyase activating enzyme
MEPMVASPHARPRAHATPGAEATFRPLVVDIKRHSLEDGPGIRSVVFFKGCPLRCSFCQNPESQDPGPELAFSAQRCLGEGLCVGACPVSAIELAHPVRLQRELCTRCGACAGACPTGALRFIGTAYEPEALAEILLRDRHYYESSHGGVTLSGGEPTMYPRYVERLLRLLKAEKLHVALETGGHFHYESFRTRILPFVDLVYFSLKIADPEAHRRHIGESNELIIENLHRLMREPGVQVEALIPLVPGVTDSRENLEGLVAILRSAGVKSARLLPYNPLGVSMAEALGRPRPPVPASFMKPEEIDRLQHMFSELIGSTRA